MLLGLRWSSDLITAMIRGQMEATLFAHDDVVRLFLAIIALARTSALEDVVLAAWLIVHTLTLHSAALPHRVLAPIHATATLLASSTWAAVAQGALHVIKTLPLHVVAAMPGRNFSAADPDSELVSAEKNVRPTHSPTSSSSSSSSVSLWDKTRSF